MLTATLFKFGLSRVVERFSVKCRKSFRVCFIFALLRSVIG